MWNLPDSATDTAQRKAFDMSHVHMGRVREWGRLRLMPACSTPFISIWAIICFGKKGWKLINCRSSFPLTPNTQEYELPANQHVWLSSKSEWSKQANQWSRQANQCFLLLHGTVDKGVSTSPLEVMWCLLSCCLKGTSAEVALRSSQLTILRLLSSIS